MNRRYFLSSSIALGTLLACSKLPLGYTSSDDKTKKGNSIYSLKAQGVKK